MTAKILSRSFILPTDAFPKSKSSVRAFFASLLDVPGAETLGYCDARGRDSAHNEPNTHIKLTFTAGTEAENLAGIEKVLASTPR